MLPCWRRAAGTPGFASILLHSIIVVLGVSTAHALYHSVLGVRTRTHYVGTPIANLSKAGRMRRL